MHTLSELAYVIRKKYGPLQQQKLRLQLTQRLPTPSFALFLFLFRSDEISANKVPNAFYSHRIIMFLLSTNLIHALQF